jgi:hypothetical protein
MKAGGGYAPLCDVTRFTFAGCCGGVPRHKYDMKVDANA